MVTTKAKAESTSARKREKDKATEVQRMSRESKADERGRGILKNEGVEELRELREF